MSARGKKIVLGVTGGIAAYKSCELVRALKRERAEIRVVMTRAATEFVQPLTFATLSGNPVVTTLFPQGTQAEIEHIDLSRWADGIVICPATANIIASLAHGFADDPVSATVRAARVPVIVCPAMNSAMWEDVLVQRNIDVLREAGYHFVDPAFGPLASASEGEGWGRLAELEHIVSEIRVALHTEKPLAGKKVLVTAGRTDEFLDPVRMITNPATGRMGFALAEAARALGAKVTLISGPTALLAPQHVEFVSVISADQMAAGVQKHYPNTDILIMAAAVADYRPRTMAANKIKKTTAPLTLKLERTTDILQLAAAKKRHAVHIGFALETTGELAYAKEKLNKKRLDLIVVNNPIEPEAGFAHSTNRVTIIDRAGGTINLDVMPKTDLAYLILDHALRFLPGKKSAAIVPHRLGVKKMPVKNERRLAGALRRS
jgi:phosphopantothenoylcysteine decarboxylase/phosphopantothenate--cysteine ligase